MKFRAEILSRLWGTSLETRDNHRFLSTAPESSLSRPDFVSLDAFPLGLVASRDRCIIQIPTRQRSPRRFLARRFNAKARSRVIPLANLVYEFQPEYRAISYFAL